MGARELLLALGAGGVVVLADGDRLLTRSSVPLADDMRAAIRASKAELLALLSVGASDDPPPPDAIGPTCTDCRHLTRRDTCLEPELARLIPDGAGFGIAWPGPLQATTCPAYTPRTHQNADGWPIGIESVLPQRRARAIALEAAVRSGADLLERTPA